jgi:hypothetical protein
VHELARRAAVAGEEAVPLPYSCSLISCSASSKVGRAHDAEHRAEDLFLVDAHRRRDVVEQRAAEEEALLVPRHLQPRPSTTSSRLPRHARGRR